MDVSNTRDRESSLYVSDFTEFKPQACQESDSDVEEDGVDPDIQDVIYAQMFFTPQPTSNKDIRQNKFSEKREEPGSSKNECTSVQPLDRVTVSLMLDGDEDIKNKRRKIDLKNMTKAEIRAFKRQRRLKIKQKRLEKHKKLTNSETPSDQHSTSSTGICNSNINSSIVSCGMSESPLATNCLRADNDNRGSPLKANTKNSSPENHHLRKGVRKEPWSRVKQNHGSEVDEAVKDKKMVQGSKLKKATPKKEESPDVIVLSDSCSDSNDRNSNDSLVMGTSTSDVIVISSDTEDTQPDLSPVSSVSEDSLLLDELFNLSSSEEDGSDNDVGMDLCDEGETVEGKIDGWGLCKKDIVGRDAYERLFEKGVRERPGRYYAQKLVKCTNCKQKGHTQKKCPWPKRHQVCYMCAGLNHVSSRCPKNKCNYCYQPQHRGRPCSMPWTRPNTSCNRCYMQGHHASICPDQWRQFHNTTYAHDCLVMIATDQQRNYTKVFCYNCASAGHYGFECTKTRPRGWPLPHLPLIARYDTHIWPPRNIHRLRQQMRIPSNPSPTPYHNSSSSVDASSRKRPPQEKTYDGSGKDGKEDYVPPARKQTKREKQKLRRSSQLVDTSPGSSIVERHDEHNRRTFNDPKSNSGHIGYGNMDGNHRNSHVRKEQPDLREFLSEGGARTSEGRYRPQHELSPYDPRGDFPRSPLIHHDRRTSFDSYRQPLMLAPSHPLPLLPPPTRNGSLLQYPVHLHNRRHSDVLDRRPDFRTRSDDRYEPSYGHRRNRTQGEGGYTSERGFRGSEHTAHMLDKHDRRYSGYGRY